MELIAVIIIIFCVKLEYFRVDLYCKDHDLLKDGNSKIKKCDKINIEEIKLDVSENNIRESRLQNNQIEIESKIKDSILESENNNGNYH